MNIYVSYVLGISENLLNETETNSSTLSARKVWSRQSSRLCQETKELLTTLFIVCHFQHGLVCHPCSASFASLHDRKKSHCQQCIPLTGTKKTHIDSKRWLRCDLFFSSVTSYWTSMVLNHQRGNHVVVIFILAHPRICPVDNIIMMIPIGVRRT